MSDHAILKPSSAARWVECPGSVKFEEGYPEGDPHPMTVEGSAIHEVADAVLQEFIQTGRKTPEWDRAKFLGTMTSNSTVVTKDMLDVVDTYVKDVVSVSARFGGLSAVMTERQVYMPNIHPENWGTVDGAVVFFDHDTRELVLSDLKAGWGIVEVEENWQLLNYAVGMLNEMVERGWALPNVIEFRLCQPRPYHTDGRVRVWRLALAELEPYVTKLRNSAADAFSESPTFRTGKHCDYCAGRHECPALRATGYRIVEVVRGIKAQRLRGAELAAHLELLDEMATLVKALQSSLEDQALSDIKNQRPVPGWEQRPKETKVKWTVPVETVFEIGDMFGVELRKTSAPTPKQAIQAGVPDFIVDTLSASSSAGFGLSRVNTKLAAKLFKPT